MSIYSYVGLPRQGKSYNVVANVILPALRQGRRVVTNVPVYRDKIFALLGSEKVVNPGELVDFPVSEVAQDPELIRKYVQAGDVFVLDEVWRIWPSEMNKSSVPECYKSLMAEHGHMVDAKGFACQIVLVTQDLSLIAPFARKLVEMTFIHTKMGHLGMDGRFRVDIYHGSITGVIGPQARRLREIYGTYEAKIWDLYKSNTMSQAKQDGANEKAVDRRANVLLKPWIVFGVPACVLIFGTCMWYLNREGNRMMHPVPKEKAVASSVHPGFLDGHREPVARGMLGGLPSVTKPVPKFRLVGYIEVPGDPVRSKALFVGEGGVKVSRSMSHCRWIDLDYLECEIDGEWVGIAGESLAAHETDAVPVSLPTGTQGRMPLSSARSPGASVASEGAGASQGNQVEYSALLPSAVAVSDSPVGAYDASPLEQDPVSGIVGYRRLAKSAAARP